MDLLANFFVDTLDTLWHTQEISKNLEYPKCVKKFIENGFRNVDLTKLCSSEKNGNFYFIQLIIIIQLN